MISTLHPLIAASLLLLLLFAVDGDLRSRQIPNALSLGGVVLGLVLHFTLGGGRAGGDALLGALTGGLMLLPLWLLRGLAGGDVKLMAAVGAHLGPAATLAATLATLIVGGLIALGVYVRRRGAAATPARNAGLADGFAYAPAIAAGTLLALCLPLLRQTLAN